MRQLAIIILILLVFSIVLEPITEYALVLKDKLVISSVTNNSINIAKKVGLNYNNLRDLDAVIDKTKFYDSFSAAFASGLNLTEKTRSTDRLTFKSVDGRYNDVVVEFEFVETVDTLTQKTTTVLKVHTEMTYIFKTTYLKLAREKSTDIDFTIESDRISILNVTN